MGLRPASPERRGTHRYTFVGTNMESLLGGFRAPRVQSTVGGKNCKHPHFTEGVWSTPPPHPGARQHPDQAHSGFRLQTFAAAHPAPLGLLPA